MGGFGAALGAVGDRLHEQNLLNWQASYHANQGIADMLEKIAPTLRSEFQPKAYQMAFKYRTLQPGKKPGKDMDLHDVFFNHAMDQLQQQAPQQGAPTANGGPAPAGGVQGGQASAPTGSSQPAGLPGPPQTPTASQGGAKGRGTDDIDAQVEAATQAEQRRIQQQQQAQQAPDAQAAIQALQQDQQQKMMQAAVMQQHDPTTPGVAGQGMSSITPLTPPPGGQNPMPNVPGMTWDQEHGRWAQLGIRSPEEQAQLAANFEAAKVNAAEAAKHEAIQRYGKQAIQTAKELGIDLTAQQQAEIMTGMRLGKSYIPIPGVGMFDQATGEVIEAAKPFAVAPGAGVWDPNTHRLVYTGSPKVALTRVVPHPDTQTGHAFLQLGIGGEPIGFAKNPDGTIAAAPVPGTEAVREHEVPITTTVNGHVVTVMVPSVSRPVLPGSKGGSKGRSAAPLTAPPGAGSVPTDTSAPPTPGSIAPGGGRVVGVSPQETVHTWENPLTPQAQKIIETATPTLQMVDRAIAMLEPHKSENTPFAHTLQRFAYQFGLSTDGSQLINNLELNKVAGAARVLGGSSRAYQALNLAMQHLPNAWRGSNKLMYEQLQSVRKNIVDTMKEARSTGQKYPGMPRSGGANGLTPTPSGVGSDPFGLRDIK